LAFYRIHLFDARGHVTATRPLQCDSDEAAIAATARFGYRAAAIEVWVDHRCVLRAPVPKADGRMPWPRA
jgi:hypothetical protein